MTTAIVYIDEAGSPERHHEPLSGGETPLFILAGLALPLADWRPRDREYLRLKRHFFPDQMGRPGRRDEEVEIKGRDLTSPRQSTSARRQAFNRRAMDFIDRCGGRAFAATFLKSAAAPVSATSLYTKALQILVERISLYIAESGLYQHAILICDSRMRGISGLDGEVARSHMSYIFGHATGRTFTNIVEAPLFADSRLTVGLQLADIFAANLYASRFQYYLRGIPGSPDYGHATAYWPALDGLQFKSAGPVEGFAIYGYRTVDLRSSEPGWARDLRPERGREFRVPGSEYPVLSSRGSPKSPLLARTVPGSYLVAMNHLERISIDPAVRFGKPCVRGTRLTVGDVLGYLAGGMTETDLLADFPQLQHDDVLACLAFAAERERRLLAIPAA